jgi:hypothetical protein
MSKLVLKWDSNGTAHDPDTGLTAHVERNGTDADSPWIWFLADWPVFPAGRENIQNECPRSSAATEEAAKRAAEETLPTPEEMTSLCRESEKAWSAYYKAQEDAASDN